MRSPGSATLSTRGSAVATGRTSGCRSGTCSRSSSRLERDEAAATLYGALDAAGVMQALPFEPSNADEFAHAVERLSARLDPTVFADAVERGRVLRDDEPGARWCCGRSTRRRPNPDHSRRFWAGAGSVNSLLAVASDGLVAASGWPIRVEWSCRRGRGRCRDVFDEAFGRVARVRVRGSGDELDVLVSGEQRGRVGPVVEDAHDVLSCVAHDAGGGGCARAANAAFWVPCSASGPRGQDSSWNQRTRSAAKHTSAIQARLASRSVNGNRSRPEALSLRMWSST